MILYFISVKFRSTIIYYMLIHSSLNVSVSSKCRSSILTDTTGETRWSKSVLGRELPLGRSLWKVRFSRVIKLITSFNAPLRNYGGGGGILKVATTCEMLCPLRSCLQQLFFFQTRLIFSFYYVTQRLTACSSIQQIVLTTIRYLYPFTVIWASLYICIL